MERSIVRDVIVLSRKSVPAVREDKSVAEDLRDTLLAHREECAGMAANMIGAAKTILVFFDGGKPVTMYNPEIVKAEKPYETEEGCLSLPGRRPCRRYRTVTVRYRDEKFRPREKRFSGFSAEVIQHEMDHFEGILI